MHIFYILINFQPEEKFSTALIFSLFDFQALDTLLDMCNSSSNRSIERSYNDNDKLGHTTAQTEVSINGSPKGDPVKSQVLFSG